MILELESLFITAHDEFNGEIHLEYRLFCSNDMYGIEVCSNSIRGRFSEKVTNITSDREQALSVLKTVSKYEVMPFTLQDIVTDLGFSS